MSNTISQNEILAVELAIRSSQAVLNGIRDDLTAVQWSGSDRERFHRDWESDVNAPLTLAANCVSMMSREVL
jgi:hypothetical protein